MNYTALMIDLMKSRSYKQRERSRIQSHILMTISLLNQVFEENIACPVEFSAGDEIQGLFLTPEAAYLYYRLFSMYLYPVKIRAGIGVGTWDIKVKDHSTTIQDGPVYHRARSAIECADDAEGYSVLFLSNHSSDITINTVIGGAAAIIENQTVYQNQLTLLVELMFPIYNSTVQSFINKIDNRLQKSLHEKNEFDHFIGDINKALPMDYIDNQQIILDVPINAEDACKRFPPFISEGKKRGIPTKLSELLNISRQVIEKALKAGNVYTARNMAITAVNEMARINREAF